MIGAVSSDYDKLNARVVRDSAEQQERERIEKAARLERARKVCLVSQSRI